MGRTVRIWSIVPNGPSASCSVVVVRPIPRGPKDTVVSKPTHSPSGRRNRWAVRSRFGNATSPGLSLGVIPLESPGERADGFGVQQRVLGTHPGGRTARPGLLAADFEGLD